MVKQDVIAFTDRVDVDIVFCLLRMWHKRFDEEICQIPLNMLNLRPSIWLLE